MSLMSPFAFSDLQEVQIPTCGLSCMTNSMSHTATDEAHLPICDAIVDVIGHSWSCTSRFHVLAAKKKVQGLQARTPQQNIRYTVAACLGNTLICISCSVTHQLCCLSSLLTHTRALLLLSCHTPMSIHVMPFRLVESHQSS